ncbi:MAG: CshA/CshB family fibrillar adhesin-related protein, partial [Clostridia bacterium]
MPFSYANAGSGPSAGGIGWFNFGNLVLNPGDSVTGLTGTLNDGTTVTFDASSLPSSFVPYTALPTAAPGFSYFGPSGYTGILGNVTLHAPLLPAYGSPSVIVISNIVVKDSGGNPVPNYTAVVADAESTNAFPQYSENWTWTTNGSPWSLFTTIGGNPPALAGVGTQTAVITGLNQGLAASYVMTTRNPTSLSLSSIGREAVAIGFAVTKVQVCKNIGDRINSADQFVLNIAGTPNSQVTTSGAVDGLQSPCAVVYGLAGNSYTISEQMAPGSVSPLSAYTQTISAVNLSPGGTVPPTGSLPINFTPALGDIVQYTILNAAP